MNTRQRAHKNGLDVAKRKALHEIADWALTRHRDAIGDHFALTDDEVQELFDFLILNFTSLTGATK